MAILPNKMVTYQDLKDMILTGDFGEKETFSAGPRCANKTEVFRVLIFDSTPEFEALSSNQLVPRRTLDSSSLNPTSFTMNITSTSHSCVYLITWTQSFGRGTIIPTIVKYELAIYGLFNGIFTAKYETYEVNGIGGGDFDFGSTGVLYNMLRNGREYEFKMRAYDSNGATSAWTTVVPQIAILDYPFFTNGYYSNLSFNLNIAKLGNGLVAAGSTTDGYHAYFIQSVNDTRTAIYAYSVQTPGHYESINIPANEVDIYKDENAYTEHEVIGGVLSNDGTHAYLTTKGRRIYAMYNPNGWTSNMNFLNQNYAYVTEVIKDISDIKASPGGYNLYYSDIGSTKITEITTTEPWDFEYWRYLDPIDIGEGPFVAQGITAVGISGFTILNGGKQIRIQVVYRDTSEDHNRLITNIVLLNTNVYYLFRESDNESVVITMEWEDPCTNFTYNLFYNWNILEYRPGHSNTLFNPLSSAVEYDYLGEVIYEEYTDEHILRLSEPI